MVALHPKRVLVPTDFSDESAKVVEDWLDQVESPDQLTVLHVAPQAIPRAPATEIAKYAEEHHTDLIVLPSHGRTGLARLMIGSVAERVVRLAHCPVLVIRE